MSEIRHSTSSISVYMQCPTLYKLSTVDGLVPLEPGYRHDLDFGSAGHEALETLYSEGGTVRKAQEAFVAAYPPEKYPQFLPAWSKGKTIRNGWLAITAYAEKWKDEDSNFEILEIEKLRDLSGEGENARVVKLDLVYRDKRDGGIRGMDHKFCGKYLDSDYYEQYEPHSQIRRYTDYIKGKWGECAGFTINAISLMNRSKAVTPRKGKNKGIRLEAGDWFDFGRMDYTLNENILQLERINTKYWTDRIEHDIETGIFGYDTSQCKRGPIRCEFRELCKEGYTWPRDEELISEWYYQQCREIFNDGDRCRLPRGDHGDAHSTEAREQASAADYVVEDDVVEEAIQ